MASPFESFVQLELGKRPFTAADGEEETILIRRGPGPRQLVLLDLAEGQFLGKVGGKLVGVPAPTGGGGGTAYTHKQDVAAQSWAVQHDKDCEFFTVSVFLSGRLSQPDEVEIVDGNNVLITFSVAVAGHVTFVFNKSA